MKFLLTSDWHLDDSPMAEYRWKIFGLIKDLKNKYNVESLYILGDLTDKKNNHDAKFVLRLIENIGKLEFDEIVLLRGNHDYLDEESPFFKFLSLFEHVSYISTEVYDSEAREQWLPNVKEFNYTLNKNAKYIFIHQPIINSKVGDYLLKNGLDVNIFKSIGDNIIFAGDIHSNQKIKNVTYVGAPYQIKFGDLYSGRILLVEDNEYTEIDTSKYFPSKVKIEIDWETLMNITTFYDTENLKKGDFIKVKISLSQKDKSFVDEFRKKIRMLAQQDGLVLGSIEFSLVKEDRSEKMIKKIMSDEEIVKVFFEKEGVDDFYIDCAKEVMK